MSASVGSQYADLRVDIEVEGGKVENISIANCFTLVFESQVRRAYKVHNFLMPMLRHYYFMPECRRFQRNLLKMRRLIQTMIDERRRNPVAQHDLLSILLSTDFYRQSGDEAIIDEIFTFFFAGMKTIQISTTNLMY